MRLVSSLLLALALSPAIASAAAAAEPSAADVAPGNDVPRQRDVHRVVGDAIARVTVDGALVLEGRPGGGRVVVDHDVIPEIDARGTELVYAKGAGDDAGVYAIDVAKAGATPRLLSRGLAFADRPLFIDDTDVVVAGAVASGISGIWIVHLDGSAPTPLTNAKLRVGRPFLRDPSYVPPPASHDSMRVENGVLTYFDGARQRSVPLLPSPPPTTTTTTKAVHR